MPVSPANRPDYLQLSERWRLEQRDHELYVFGGQDAIFTIELEGDATTFFASLRHGEKFRAAGLTISDRIIAEQLISAEVVVPAPGYKRTGKAPVRLKVIGATIEPPQDGTVYKQVTGNGYDFILFIRTAGSLGEFLQTYDYANVAVPHLFLDLAYEHTISLGPLVFPGLTSCVACLKGRVETRWGDDTPPPEARSVSELSGLAAEWAGAELKALFNGEDYTLVNKTLVMDMQNRSITSNKLHTVPLCTYCRRSELLSSGKLEYYTAAKAYRLT